VCLLTISSKIESRECFADGWMDGWLGFNGILSTQVAAISCLSLKFVSKANGVYKRDYTFRMNVMEEIFEIRSCIEILANDIKVNTALQLTENCNYNYSYNIPLHR